MVSLVDVLIVVAFCFAETSSEPGIGTDAAKVVTDCIHSSRVKEMGVSLLKKNGSAAEEEIGSGIFPSADRLDDAEVQKFQNKLARSIIVFLARGEN